jgi:hypothetical protein
VIEVALFTVGASGWILPRVLREAERPLGKTFSQSRGSWQDCPLRAKIAATAKQARLEVPDFLSRQAGELEETLALRGCFFGDLIREGLGLSLKLPCPSMLFGKFGPEPSAMMLLPGAQTQKRSEGKGLVLASPQDADHQAAGTDQSVGSRLWHG